MPKEYEMTKIQLWGVQLLGGFFDALHRDQLTDFLKSEELQRFLHEAEGGSIEGKVPDGTPGSKFPGLGSGNPLDVLHDLFGGLGAGFGDGTPGSKLPDVGGGGPLDVLHDIFSGPASGLGKIDHQAGGDPAATGSTNIEDDGHGHVITTHKDDQGNITRIDNDGHGNIQVHTDNRDGSSEEFELHADGSSRGSQSYANGGGDWWSISSDGHGGSHIVGGDHHSRNYGPDGRPYSPGEDGGGDTNSDRNPLSGIDIGAPQSMEQMLNQMKNPGKDPNDLDPNTGAGGITFTEQDKERLGRIVPGAEVLDPNSGIDPLSQLNIDPSQIHTRSEEDDLDPNTGQDQPLPIGR